PSRFQCMLSFKLPKTYAFFCLRSIESRVLIEIVVERLIEVEVERLAFSSDSLILIFYLFRSIKIQILIEIEVKPSTEIPLQVDRNRH
ncbi:unnamed protein product, partial [Rotaria magnacalcarata]